MRILHKHASRTVLQLYTTCTRAAVQEYSCAPIIVCRALREVRVFIRVRHEHVSSKVHITRWACTAVHCTLQSCTRKLHTVQLTVYYFRTSEVLSYFRTKYSGSIAGIVDVILRTCTAVHVPSYNVVAVGRDNTSGSTQLHTMLYFRKYFRTFESTKVLLKYFRTSVRSYVHVALLRSQGFYLLRLIVNELRVRVRVRAKRATYAYNVVHVALLKKYFRTKVLWKY